jgi:hypothetical protein
MEMMCPIGDRGLGTTTPRRWMIVCTGAVTPCTTAFALAQPNLRWPFLIGGGEVGGEHDTA